MVALRVAAFLLITHLFLAISSTASLADYVSSERWFNSLALEERGLLQSQLMLLGHYGAVTDGIFGNFTYRAIQAFQTERGDRPTGVLTPRALDDLADKASRRYSELGFDLVRDTRGGMVLLMPTALLILREETRRGISYSTPDGSIRLETIRKPYAEESYESLFHTLSASSSTRSIRYRYLDSDNFVVSGLRAGQGFYIRISNTPEASAGFSMEWSRERNQLASMLAVFLASHSYPLAFDSDGEPEAPPVTAAPRGLSSGTGFFVADGIVVTNHHVIDRCATIDVVGYGSARIITSDEEIDLAVLQLRTPKEHPVAEIRRAPAVLGEDVVALGFPLASLLNSSLNVGTGIVSSETGLMGEQRWFTTNVGLQPGNSGGPILDNRGRVLGVAVARMNDEALLASLGVTAPNIGFAIKNDSLAKYLSIFRLPEANESKGAPKTTRELVEIGRTFTVQVLCEVQESR